MVSPPKGKSVLCSLVVCMLDSLNINFCYRLLKKIHRQIAFTVIGVSGALKG